MTTRKAMLPLLLPVLIGVNASSQSVAVNEADQQRYREAVIQHLDNLLKHGRDVYGPVKTNMLVSVIDTRTNTMPEDPEVFDSLIRTEDRLHRRNPRGADLWDDQPLLRTLHTASKLTSDTRYATAADAYTADYLKRSVKPNGLLAWGSHIYYDVVTDAPAGDQGGAGPHETLVLIPDWPAMYRVDPEAVGREIEGIWEWHMVDDKTGLFNRHDDKQLGCDFAFMGGELVLAFAFMSTKDDGEPWLDRAITVANRHWNARNPDTNLMPDAPSTGDRYDAHHCFTTLPGPYASQLLAAWQVSGETLFRDRALATIESYLQHGWDAQAQRYYGMLTLDGTPVLSQEKGAGYDRWKPTGYVDTWRTTMFSYEFPLIAAQTAIHAYNLTGSEAALEAAKNWAAHIRQDLPINRGRRWKTELAEAIPAIEQHEGAHAECYGRAISFFLAMHYTTNDAGYLHEAKSIADAALTTLQQNGWITGLPTKPLYETVDGVPTLLYALLELAAWPKQLPPNL